jgi:aspartate/methionine/tyrosine aminotransferase
MKLPPFELEQFFARYEFTVEHLLCASDVEGITLDALLALADEDSRSRYQALSLGYTEGWGGKLLREQIAKDYVALGAEHVLVTGAQEAIFLTMITLLGPSDHVIVAWPAYQSLYEVARATGADVTLLPLARTGHIEPEALRAALRPNTKLIVLNYPHNPSGALISAATQRALVDIARDANAYLFFDEMYRFLEHDPASRLPPAADLYERAISYAALSKAYGLAGLRLGWLACQDHDLLARIQAHKDYTSICQSGPSEALALIGLRAREALLERAFSIIRPNLDRLDVFFSKHQDYFTWKRPAAASVGLVELHGEPAAAFADRLVKACGVLMLPASAFGMKTNELRLGFGRNNMQPALDRLAAFLTR